MKSSIIAFIIVLLISFLICCLCLSILFLTGTFFSFSTLTIDEYFTNLFDSTPQATPVVIRPGIDTDIDNLDGEAVDVAGNNLSFGEISTNYVTTDTLITLDNTVIPINDLLELAERLGGKKDVPKNPPEQADPLEIGDQDWFWVSNTDTDENFQIIAELKYITDHAYFWVQNGFAYNHNELEALALAFENKIYPTNRAFFGSEWITGIDGDEHLYILFASGLGSSLAGYFSSADEYPQSAHEFSNSHEIFMLNLDNIELGDEFTYGVLAHEFQHMIHWYQDRNETTWLNEGFSELAAYLNGYGVGGFDILYSSDPDIQLNNWPINTMETDSHYGAAFLFVAYFLDRFGEEATKSLVNHPDNGIPSINAVLNEIGAKDQITGKPIFADDLILDWLITSYVLNGQVGDGRYTYHNYSDAPQSEATERIRSCPTQIQTRDVSQFGVDYIRIDCKGDLTLRFEGSISASVIPSDPYSGNYAVWSNRGDESDMTMTREFDFTDVSGSINLSYYTWFDIEEGFDYLYLEVSEDGEIWKILPTPSGTSEDPSGNSYGWAYTGHSINGTWIREQVDLRSYSGKKIYIRFEYITDAGVNGEGFIIDDVAIDAIGYFTDFENDMGGWNLNGFVRIQNILPQTYRIALITHGNTTSVDYIPLNIDNSAEVSFTIDDDVKYATLVVVGTTRSTRQKAAYRYQIEK